MSSLLLALCLSGIAADQPAWVEAERGILEHHAQLTFQSDFVKAGESYFSPDGNRVIFQGVHQPENGSVPDDFYAMFVADVVRAEGHVTGLTNLKRLSPPGSANTCGWFHPSDPNTVIFASTLTPPVESDSPGYQRGTSRYRWAFPKEMRIVSCELRTADGSVGSLRVLAGDGTAYHAEGSVDPSATWLLYCSLESSGGDIVLQRLSGGEPIRLVSASGYDGGPFFSPDARRICYRSDRRQNDRLQLFVGELQFDANGNPTGLAREFQLTDDEHVNWCPFWHPDGRHLVFATSRLGHENYEVFLIDADAGTMAKGQRPTKYGTGLRRVTHADSADVLPAFSADGRTMIWTSKRDDANSAQLWAADFVMNLNEAQDLPMPTPADAPKRLTIEDPETGAVYVYDMATHKLSRYNPQTHELTEVTDATEAARVGELFKQGKGTPLTRP